MNIINDNFTPVRLELKVDNSGKGSCSIRGAARLCGISDSVLVRAFDPANISTSKLAMSLVDKGFNPADFASSGIPDIALTIIVEYYAFDAGKRCTEEAKAIARILMAIGTRTWIQKELNWKPEKPLPTPEPLQLEQSVEYAERIIDMKGELPEAMRQIFFDQLGDRLLTDKTYSNGEPRLVGVAQLAEEMGYPVNASNRTTLGKFVKAQGLESIQEERLCNGTMRKINVYEHSEDLENTIHEYFTSRNILSFKRN